MKKFISDPKKYYDSLAKKPIGAGVLFFNQKEELLIVKPWYKNYWSIPGGAVDQNESPQQAVEREVEEEIGLKVKIKNLTCVDYVINQKMGKKADSIQFLFNGGVLSKNQIGKIKIDNVEITEYQFLEIERVLPKLGKIFRKRLKKALATLVKKEIIYLENGKFIK